MTQVLIASAYPENRLNFAAREMRAWVQANPTAGWSLTRDPAAAELIAFVEHHPPEDPLCLRVWFHAYRRRWPGKSALFHDADLAIPLMRGIYPSVGRRLAAPGQVESWLYVTQFCPNDAVQHSPVSRNETYLYSFVGAARTHTSRAAIMDLRDERAHLQDTSTQNGWELRAEERGRYHEEYARILSDSKFVLCPRGISPSSYRLLEAMKAGRAPVIVSDDWVRPVGPAWDEFAIFVREADVRRIPALLRTIEADAPERGRAARRAWETWCADEVKYRRLLERFVAVQRNSQRSAGRRIWPDRALFSSRAGQRALWRSTRSMIAHWSRRSRPQEN